jgi:hypothetical protein
VLSETEALQMEQRMRDRQLPGTSAFVRGHEYARREGNYAARHPCRAREEKRSCERELLLARDELRHHCLLQQVERQHALVDDEIMEGERIEATGARQLHASA